MHREWVYVCGLRVRGWTDVCSCDLVTSTQLLTSFHGVMATVLVFVVLVLGTLMSYMVALLS